MSSRDELIEWGLEVYKEELSKLGKKFGDDGRAGFEATYGNSADLALGDEAEFFDKRRVGVESALRESARYAADGAGDEVVSQDVSRGAKRYNEANLQSPLCPPDPPAS